MTKPEPKSEPEPEPSSGSVFPLALWQRWGQWGQTATTRWLGALEESRATTLNPYHFYSSWWQSFGNAQQKMRREPGRLLGPREAWNLWLETTTGAWNNAIELSSDYFLSYAHLLQALQSPAQERAKTAQSSSSTSRDQSPQPADTTAAIAALKSMLPHPTPPWKALVEDGHELHLPPIGTRMSRTRTITEEDVVQFALLSGDHNPIHLNEEYAGSTQFGERIAHGLLVASLTSALLGNDLPGHGAIYLGQTLKFLAPVHLGDTVTVSAEVVSIREDKHILTLRTDCVDQEDTLIFTGEATVKYKP